MDHSGPDRRPDRLPRRPEVDIAVAVVAASLDEPPRIVIAGDTHGELGWVQYLCRAAARADAQVVVVLGDFGYWAHTRAGQRFLDDVDATTERSRLHVVFIDGNHDNTELLWSCPYPTDPAGFTVVRPRLRYVRRGLRWVWGGIAFLAAGGAASTDRDARVQDVDWWPTEDLRYADVAACLDAGPIDVMFSHDCPAGFALPFDAGPDLDAGAGTRRTLAGIVEAVGARVVYHGHRHWRHSDTIDIGGRPVLIEGLDRDGTMSRGYLTVALTDLAA